MYSRHNKKALIKALPAILAIGMLIFTYLTARWDGWEIPYIGLAVLAAALCFVINNLRKRSGVFHGIFQGIFLLITPLASVLLLQNYMIDPFGLKGFLAYFQDPVGVKGMYPLMLLTNCVFAYLFFLLASSVLGSFRAGYTLGAAAAMIIGIANYYVIAFRGTPIVPWDFFALRTAASVAGNYTYETDWRFLFSTFAFIVLICLAQRFSLSMRHIIPRVIFAIICLAGLISAGYMLQKKEVKDYLGMDQTLFTPTVRYRNNGFLAAFIGNLHLINVEKPSGYSVKKVEEIGAEIEMTSPQTLDLADAPNIIVIMDEAFSDLSVLGEFGVDNDYLPNFRKLQKENVGGYLMTSVKGGNTANTEYEFLAGDSMAFLPEGSVVFQQFIHDNVPALPSQLASLGYSTIGIHPYLGSGWNRDTVYSHLGFQSFLTQSDFSSPKRIREYISDESAFEKIISEFENKADNEKQFIFEVTMQNHSGYSKEYSGFYETVHLSGLTRENVQTKAVQKYLTLIQESDQAIGMLIDYFKTVEEPTIIVIFGDHQPTDYITNVIANLTGYDGDDSLEEQQKAYLVPYLVWNNFDLDIDVPALTSPNFLAADILKAAGIPATAYQQFLLTLQKTLPVVSGRAYVDAAGVYHSYEEEDEVHDTLLEQYQILAYNHLVDTQKRVSELFTAPLSEKN